MSFAKILFLWVKISLKSLKYVVVFSLLMYLNLMLLFCVLSEDILGFEILSFRKNFCN